MCNGPSRTPRRRCCRDKSDKGDCVSLKYTLPKKAAVTVPPIRMDSVQSYTGNTNSNPNWGAQVYFPTFTGIPVTMNVDGKSETTGTVTKTAVANPGATGAAAGALPGAGGAGSSNATAARAAAVKGNNPANMLNMTLSAAKMTANGTGLSSSRTSSQKNGVAAAGGLGMLLTALLGALLALLV
jgi:hypothetical protein